MFYSSIQCKDSDNIGKATTSFGVLSYIALLMSLLTCKIVGLELFGVLQLAYFSLSLQSFMNIYIAPLVGLRTMNGLNIEFAHEKNTLPISI